MAFILLFYLSPVPGLELRSHDPEADDIPMCHRASQTKNSSGGAGGGGGGKFGLPCQLALPVKILSLYVSIIRPKHFKHSIFFYRAYNFYWTGP